jgi:hypothetical protein
MDSIPTTPLTEPGTSGCLSVESVEGPIRFILMLQEPYLQMRPSGESQMPSASESSGSTCATIWSKSKSR